MNIKNGSSSVGSAAACPVPEALVQRIIEKLNMRLGNQSPELAHFDISLDAKDAPGVLLFLNTARAAKVGDLLLDPGAEHLNMPLVCLLLVRINGDVVPFPGEDLLLGENDRLLLWGAAGSHHRLHLLIRRADLFESVLSSRRKPAG